MSFFKELKRRNVFRVAIAYLAVAWLVVQVADVVLDNISAPGWVFQTILLVVLLGFPIILVFSWAYELTPDGLKRDHEVDRGHSISRATGRKLDFAIIGVLAVALVYFVWESRFSAPAEDETVLSTVESTNGTANDRVSDTAPQASIAVLPFINMSRDQDNEYFSDGLTETLLHMLAQLPDLRVAARTSSFAFKGKSRSIPEIAAELGVAHILEGSVQKADQRIRVTAQLVRATDGFHVWSQNYTRPLEDIFAIQDEIASDVAEALGASLLGTRPENGHIVSTSSLTAFDSYLRGLEQQAIFSYGSLGLAESHFRQALSLDPGFADARLALIRNYLLKFDTGLIREEELEREVEPLLRQVRERDPGSPTTRLFELVTHLYTQPNLQDRQALEASIEESLSILVQLPTETHFRSAIANFIGLYLEQPKRAAEVLEVGLLIDPLSPNLLQALGSKYIDLDRLDEARIVLERALKLAPERPNAYNRMFRLETANGRMAEALEWLRKATIVDREDHEYAAQIAIQLYWLRLPEEAERWRARVEALAPDSAVAQLVELERLAAQGLNEEMLSLARSMIEDQVSMRFFAYGTALIYYSDLMLRQGSAREGYDFLVALRPAIADYATLPVDWQDGFTQLRSIDLMYGFASPAEHKEAWTLAAAARDQAGVPWRDEDIPTIDHLVRGDIEGAVQAYLEYLEPPLASGIYRNEKFFARQMAPVYEDPRITARFAELNREFQAMRAEVLDMLRRPEWNE